MSLVGVPSLQNIPSSENGVSSSPFMALCVHAGLDAHDAYFISGLSNQEVARLILF